MTESRQDAPWHLARILEHCLQKDPEARFQTAKDVRNELRALRKEVESGAEERIASAQDPTMTAAIRAWRGEADAAFAWLDKGVATRDLGLAFIKAEPFLLFSLRDDPRWKPLLRKIGLPTD